MDAGGDISMDWAGGAPTLRQVQDAIFTPLCSRQCHTGGDPPKGLHLTEERSYDGLVGVAAQEVPEILRVVPGNADESYLFIKVVPFDERRRDKRMPRDGPPFLASAEVEMIRAWIEGGARP